MTEKEGTRVSGGQVRTFLIADVRGYTRFTLEHGDEAAAELAAHFAAIARETVSTHEGEVIELRGDEALAVFPSARQALWAASELQDRFAEASLDDPSLPLKVGIGLDAGEAIPFEGGYRGAALNLAARLCSLAGSGEVLASEGVVHLARKVEGLEYADRGEVSLKGFAAPVRVVQIDRSEHDLPSPGGGGIYRAQGTGVRGEEAPLPIGGFLGALPSGELVARQDELDTILTAVDAVAGGSGRLVLLGGEPGVGKTRLAQEVTLAVRNRGFLVAAGRCYEPRQTIPYYPFLDALATLYGAAPPSVRGQIPQRWPYLGRLLPEAGIPIAGLGAEGQEEQERLFRAVTGYLQAIAAETPVALLLDDLHWADGASLELLQHLARHTRAYRVLLLGTYRDMEVRRQHPLERALRDLTREQLVQRIPVRRLDQVGTAALIGATFGEEEISEEFTNLVHRHTEGNPFFTQEVLQALVERGDIYREDGRWERREIEEIEVPESVRSTIDERLSRLSEDTQELLHVASVLGQIFKFDALQVMGERSAQRTEEEVEQGLDEAISAGLIRETVRDHYSFNHALTQQALYAELSGRRKRRLHLAAGEALEGAGPSEGRAAELAWHFLEGDDPQRALRYALQAGDEAEEVFGREEAKQHYRTALDLAREVGNQSSEAEARLKLGVLLRFTADSDEAARLLEGARELYEMLGNQTMEARAAVEAVPCYGIRGLVEEADRALASAEPLVTALEGAEPTRDLALVYRALSTICIARGRYDQALALTEQEMKVARSLGDDRLLNRAEIDRAAALGLLGRVRDAVQVAEGVIPPAETAGDLETLKTALFTAAEYSMLAGELAKSREYRERELAVAQRLGDAFLIGGVLANLAQVTCYQGDWEASLTFAERAFTDVGSMADTDLPGHRMARTNRGAVLMLQGNREEGIRDLDQVADPSSNPMLQLVRYARRELAEHDLLMGHPERALARLEPLVEGADSRDTDVTVLLPILAWAYLDTGDTARAVEVGREAQVRATAGQNGLALVDALRVHGMVLARQQQWDEAKRAFEEAVALARPMPYPFAEACALYEWGLMHGAKGEPAPARQRLEEALVIFRRLGARPYVERTERVLAVSR